MVSSLTFHLIVAEVFEQHKDNVLGPSLNFTDLLHAGHEPKTWRGESEWDLNEEQTKGQRWRVQLDHRGPGDALSHFFVALFA